MKSKEKHIDEFSSFKKLYKLSKPRSPLFVEFMTEDLPDEWLIDIVRYKRKSGIVAENFMILQKEIDTWMKGYKEKGWVIID